MFYRTIDGQKIINTTQIVSIYATTLTLVSGVEIDLDNDPESEEVKIEGDLLALSSSLIRLTLDDGSDTPVWVNPAHIQYIEENVVYMPAGERELMVVSIAPLMHL